MNTPSTKHETILEQVAIYDALSPEEQRTVDEYVRTHPELAAHLEANAEIDADLRALAEYKAELVANTYADRLAHMRKALQPIETGRLLRPQRQAGRMRPQWATVWAGMAALVALSILLTATLGGGHSLVQRMVYAVMPTLVPTDGATMPQQDAMSEDVVTITFGCDLQFCAKYALLASEFHKQYPHIQVEIQETSLFNSSTGGVAAQEKITEPERATRTAAELDTFAYHFLEHSAIEQPFMDLTPFMQRDSSIGVDDFYPQTLGIFQWEGGTWALPSTIMPELMFYNKDAFDVAGLAYPDLEWTESDFLALARQLTQHDAGQTESWGFVDRSGAVRSAILNTASQAIVRDTTPVDLLEAAERIEWYANLAMSEQIMPVPADTPTGGTYAEEDFAQIIRGNVAMWTDYLSGYQQINRNRYKYGDGSVPTLGLASLPVTGGQSSLSWGPGYYISAQTPYAEESWLWLQFLTEQYVELYPERGMIPARSSIAAETGYWEQWTPEERAVIEYALHNSEPIRSFDDLQMQVYFHLIESLESIFSGKPVTDALAEAQQQMDDQLSSLAIVQPTPVVASTMIVHTVQMSETLLSIANQYGVSAEAIIAANDLDDPTLIFPGQELFIPLDGPPSAPTVSPTPATQSSTGNMEVITLTFGCHSSRCPAYAALAETFHEMYPNIRIEMQEADAFSRMGGGAAPQEELTEPERAARYAAEFDTFADFFVESAAIDEPFPFMDLTPYIQQDANLSTDDFYPHALELYQSNNRLWGLPTTIMPVVMLYNKAAFDAAGLQYPGQEWTEEEFVTLARQLAQQPSDDSPGWVFADDAQGLRYALLRQASISIAQEYPVINLDSEADTLAWYTDLALANGIMPNPNEPSTVASSRVDLEILRGNMAMWTSTIDSNVRAASERYGYNALPTVGMAPLPVEGNRSILFFGNGHYMSAHTKHPDESWLWLEFLTRCKVEDQLEASDTLYDRWRAVPARRSTAEETGYWDQWNSEERAVLQYSLENSAPVPSASSLLGQVHWALTQALEEIWTGSSVEDALAAAQLQMDERLHSQLPQLPTPTP